MDLPPRPASSHGFKDVSPPPCDCVPPEDEEKDADVDFDDGFAQESPDDHYMSPRDDLPLEQQDEIQPDYPQHTRIRYTEYQRQLLGTGDVPSYSLCSASAVRATWQVPRVGGFLKEHVFVSFVQVRDWVGSVCHSCSDTWENVDFLVHPASYELLKRHTDEELASLSLESPSCLHQTDLLKVVHCSVCIVLSAMLCSLALKRSHGQPHNAIIRRFSEAPEPPWQPR
jgi:hypothetical protein